MRKQFERPYSDIVSLENLFAAWGEFVKGKRGKRDVQEFAFCLTDNIVQLHEELAHKTYKHGPYRSFHITDPKPRHIHKASVRDRVLHHAIYRVLYPFFDRTFIADSFSCRIGKGTHRALSRFRARAYQVGRNNTRTCWILKCDIEKFFASIDHEILLGILGQYISPVIARSEATKQSQGQEIASPPSAARNDIIWLLEEVIESFCVRPLPASGHPPQAWGGERKSGLPLGNLTSQLFCNIYMNEFDQFVKHKLKAKFCIRYADDFVLASPDRNDLASILSKISNFLQDRLHLSLHPYKIILKTLASGVDFLGWIYFSNHKVLRTATKRRMLCRVHERPAEPILQSYLGLLAHGNAYGVRQEVLRTFWLNHLQE